MGNIFISYRRQDTSTQARKLHDLLARRFSQSCVFFDVSETISGGTDFIRLLEERISTCDALLAVIGPEWNPFDSDGVRRLEDPANVVRMEVSIALQNHIPVLPILISGTTMPRTSELPEDLRGLTRKQAVVISGKNLERGTRVLLGQLDRLLTNTLDKENSKGITGNSLLRLELRDIYGDFIKTPVELVLRNQAALETKTFPAVDAARKIVIPHLSDSPDIRYTLDVQSRVHRTVRWTVAPSTWKTDLVTQVFLPLDPSRVRKPRFPKHAELSKGVRRLLRTLRWRDLSGEALYNAFDPLQTANLLNCLARASTLLLADGQTLQAALDSSRSKLVHLRQDRIQLRIPDEVADLIRSTSAQGFLQPVSSALHQPPPGYAPAGSLKTLDLILSFQLTLFSNGSDHVLEMEFDEIQGMACVFRIVERNFTGMVHPYDVHQLLVRHQRINPGYRLDAALPRIKRKFRGRRQV